ncbi:MAG TPA: AraC family transcriptional regulator [Burkholderiales bacterium]|nr:AraC family transcriptional regulator [Burkholderiales bacterium]
MKVDRSEVIAVQSLRPASVEEGMLRVSILAEVPRVLEALGQNPGQVLQESGLDPALLRDPENTIPFHAVGALLEHCVARTGCRHFGLLVGERGGVATVGVVGLLLRNSRDVGAALRNLIKYLHFHDRGAVPTLAVEGHATMLGYAIYAKGVPASEQICAGSMAVASNIMRSLCGADWHPTEVLFPFRKPADLKPYNRFFRAPLRFDAEQAALAFPAAWLDHPLSGADPEVQRAIESLLVALDAPDRVDIAARVRRVVRAMLIGGRASEGEVAHAFSMHRRTLNRRLRFHGTTFQTILAELRFEMACQLLRDTDNSVGDIATAVGYSGSSPFGRAFRHWSGMTPAEWRDRTASEQTRR